MRWYVGISRLWFIIAICLKWQVFSLFSLGALFNFGRFDLQKKLCCDICFIASCLYQWLSAWLWNLNCQKSGDSTHCISHEYPNLNDTGPPPQTFTSVDLVDKCNTKLGQYFCRILFMCRINAYSLKFHQEIAFICSVFADMDEVPTGWAAVNLNQLNDIVYILWNMCTSCYALLECLIDS